jgi:gas vesicle protein
MVFGFGLVVGTLLGVVVGLVVAHEDGATFRRDLRRRARRFGDVATARARQAGETAEDLYARGRTVADRVRTAAVEGLREVRKQDGEFAPPRSDLSGVAGMAEPL